MKYAGTLALVLVLLSPAHATKIYVPGDQPTIQAGIDAADIYDTVWVASGEYHGDGNRDLDFHGKDIAVIGNGARIYCDGTEAEPHRAFYLHSGETEFAIIQGFFITEAYGDGYYWDAAIRCDNASPHILNCAIRNNMCAGILLENGSGATVRNCTLVQNEVCGIIVDASPAVITDCELSFQRGDGILWKAQWYGYQLEVSNCLFHGNDDTGLELMIGSGLFHVYNCTMARNNIGFSFDWDFPKTTSDVVAPTSIDVSTVENCISAFNDTYGMSCHVWAGNVNILCNDAFGNGTEDFYLVGEPTGLFEGNITEDPQFCDWATGDFDLNDLSPCRPENNDCGVLMGAFDESCGCCRIVGDYDHSGQLDPLDLIFGVEWMWNWGPAPYCPEEEDVNGDGQSDPLDLIYLVDYFWKGGPPPVECPEG